ncbi:hypothetical protein OG896_24495 [Streptomyces sp. NBC_00669]|uniref:hypothetical protein n=1 Tax=Streptomyces sp. NBC_00669 TaxID=2976011 RepID=UPI002E3588C2|nr:hypothetical protein [Streptomyces sp. NBC_00669]
MALPDIVYAVRPGEHNEALRYSLRSVAAHVPHRRVWIAGYCPRWAADVGAIPVPKRATKYASSTANLRAAAEHDGVSGEFLYFNDDFFVMKPLAGGMPVFHRGPVARVEAYYATRGRGQYLRGLRDTKALLAGLGHPNPLSYELHVPMPMTKTRLLETLDTGAHLPVLHKRTLYGNLHGLGGNQIPDPKILTRGPRFPRSATFLSTMPDTFNHGAVGTYIRARFPTPGPYETGRRR